MVAADCGHDEIVCALVHFVAMAFDYVKNIFDNVFVIWKSQSEASGVKRAIE